MPTHSELPVQFGRYHLLKKLGQGGMGAVYLVEDTRLARQVALKVPRFSPEDGPRVIERFYREARVAATIEHPNICPVYDVGEIDGVHFLTMPFIDGIPLSKKVDSNQPLPAREAVALVRRIALAVGAMHERGVFHRDLKPANVLIRPNGEPVVMDFGLARSVSGTDRLTATGEALGTPAYMSPEQVVGQQAEVAPTTDVYSLGVILFELVTGQLPFVGPLHVVLAQILYAPARPPSSLLPGLSPQLDAICLKAMAKLSGERYTSMSDFAAALSPGLQQSGAALPSTRTTAQHASLAETRRVEEGKRETRNRREEGGAPPPGELPLGRPSTNPARESNRKTPPRSPGTESKLASTVDPTEQYRLHRAMLLDRVRPLLRLHKKPGVVAWISAILVGIVLGFFGGGLASAAGIETGILTAIVLFAISIWWFLWKVPQRRALSREKLIGDIVEAFPHEVQQWGGPSVLRVPAAVRELIQILEKKC